MKFECEKAELQSAINAASRVCAVKSIVPAMEGLLLTAEITSGLTITGYNLKTGIVANVNANIKECGRCVVDSKFFGQIIAKMPDDIVAIERNGNVVLIECGPARFRMTGVSPDDYPELPNASDGKIIYVPKNDLRTAIQTTLFAVSLDESRPVHTGELFELENSRLTIVAVDGYRLALRKITVQEQKTAKASFVVHRDALKEVIGLCNQAGDNVEISVGDKHIQFSVEGMRLITRRLEGEFLNYHNAISQNNHVSVVADRKMLISAIERCSLIITEQQKSPLRCTLERNIMKFKTATAIGTAYDECMVASSGEKLEIGFNNKYMLDALKAAPTDLIRLKMNSPVSPCVMLPEEGKPENFVFMVLPVRLRAGQ